jgi:hypothetical protein
VTLTRLAALAATRTASFSNALTRLAALAGLSPWERQSLPLSLWERVRVRASIWLGPACRMRASHVGR